MRLDPSPLAAEITGPITVFGVRRIADGQEAGHLHQAVGYLVKKATVHDRALGAVQICPEWKDQVEPMQPTAALTSASSRTTQAPLPPSSSSERFMVRAAISADLDADLRRAGEADALDVAGLDQSEEEDGVLPLTRFTTPGGKPTSWRMRTSSTMARGSCGAGFTTTVLPEASAGATLPAMLTMGKLYEVMHATTPRGWRFTMPPMIPPGASGVAWAGWGSSGVCSTDPWVACVPLEAVGRDGDLHARAHRGRRSGLRDHQGEQVGCPGPDGRRRLTHQRAAIVLRPSRPTRLGLFGGGGRGEGVVHAGVRARPTTSSVAGLTIS